ncbi:dTDP-4-dehydrorhamnose 3,5-epimerase [Ornithinimicrobium humiphilum]|uniref:dTDP-4-dehydrorhamnose reductase n=1 Tax=Ornithinimicrobium humiphilum TaxID=125288 RepID=A0A543KJN7_9MICO|nr:dTDP-4-dehydrorhamnose 3,5-epimerase [Ornithinimicrobium humiphilum]
MTGGQGVRGTSIPGLVVVDLTVHADARGWFKENWQRARMTAAGLPDFGPVQHSVAHNTAVGTTRGIHAEPWDKFVSVVHGRAFGAWVDLREGPTFGTVHTEVLDPATAVFVPRGVGNSYQTLEAETVYSYLVNDHWSPHAEYTMLNLADETVAIDWPIPLSQAVVSEKDLTHPRLADVTPVAPPATLVLGADGQVGRALLQVLPGAQGVTRAELDLAVPGAVEGFDFTGVGTVVNAAAYTAVDAAQTVEGRAVAWATNATGVAALARAATRYRFTLVHYSSDYVFDGTAGAYDEDAPLAPLGVYGQSKAAGDLAVVATPRHYVIRTSWVVGDGRNFVATMAALADQGRPVTVVDDQVGRLSFATDLGAGTLHLLTTGAPYGTYNLTGSGEPASWADLARAVYTSRGADPALVTPTTTDAWAAEKPGPVAPRPPRSVLSLDKITATGFTPTDQHRGLATYLRSFPPGTGA